VPTLSDIAIRLDDVHLTLGSGSAAVEVLRGLSFAVARGERVGVVGASGSGKSTALMVTTGLEKADRGRVEVAGTDLGGLDEDGLALFRGANVGIVFQSFNLFPHMSVLDNITAAPIKVLGQGRAEAKERAMELLARIQLDQKALEYPDRLSGGQQQRVAIVRALAMDPIVLLLDEITSALDPELVSEVLNIVRDLSREGMTMVLATHEMGFAKEVASKVCFLYGGVVHEEGPPSQIFSEPKNERTRAFLERIIEAGRL